MYSTDPKRGGREEQRLGGNPENGQEDRALKANRVSAPRAPIKSPGRIARNAGLGHVLLVRDAA